MRFRQCNDAVNEGLERDEKRAQRRGFGVGFLSVGLLKRLPVCNEQVVGGDVEVVLDRVCVRRDEIGEVLELDGHANAGLQVQGPDIRFLFETQHGHVQRGFGKRLGERLNKWSNQGILGVTTEEQNKQSNLHQEQAAEQSDHSV